MIDFEKISIWRNVYVDILKIGLLVGYLYL